MEKERSEQGYPIQLLNPDFEECRDLLMNAPVGIFTSTPEGRLVFANRALAGLFGYDSPRSMVDSVSDAGSQIYSDPDDRMEFRRLMDTQGWVENHECRMTRRDGSVFWASFMARRVVREENGHVLYQGYVSDITERKQAEDKFTQVFLTAPNCIAIVRLEDSSIMDVNGAFEETTGWLRGEAVGKSSRETGLWADPSEHEYLVSALREGRDILNREFRFTNRAGELREGVYSARSMLIRDEPHFILTLQDVSQRKLDEESLRLTQFAMDQAADSILWVDDRGMIIYANRAACESMGFTRKELLEKRVFDVDPDFPESGWEQHKKDLKRLGKMSFEGRHRTRDGGVFPVEVTTNYIEYKGRFLGIAFDRNITERKRSEEERERLQKELFQAQKMESLGILAGGVAHDFNNLLQIVGGNIELLLSGKPPGHPDVDRLKTVSRSISRAGRLVQQMLLFGRKAMVRRKPLDLNREVLEALKILGRTIPKMIRIRHRLADNLWPVAADPVQVEQVMLNLGANAVDAMPEGGELTVETGNILLKTPPTAGFEDFLPGRYVLLTVADTGCGMTCEVMNHVFDPFFTTKEAGRGTGLGLATTYGIVKAHRGCIQCRSEPDRGAVFSIYWPALEGEAAPEPAQPPETLRTGSETVLVVDDETEIVKLTGEYLKSLGYRVLGAETGEQALEVFAGEAGGVSLVLLDLNMPGMGGIRCLHRILELSPEARVLVSSGYMEEDHSREALASGAMGFIGKPYRMRDLGIRVREVLDREEGPAGPTQS